MSDAPKFKTFRDLRSLPVNQNKPPLEIVPPAAVIPDEVSVTKSNEAGVSRSNQEQVSVSKSKAKKVETSPSRNFTKVSNSINYAIPEKYFRGLSKHTYDVLYQKTRGAINPVRIVQMTKSELVQLTGLSKDAVKLHIKYLKEKGLVQSRPAIGSREGWEYEVFVPEEIGETDEVSVSKSEQVSVTKGDENLRLPSDENLLTLTRSNPDENKGLNQLPKTSFKDKRENDDELTRLISAKLFEAHGRHLSEKEKAKMDIIRDAVADILGAAFQKADSISDAVSFAAEHFKRLAAKPQLKLSARQNDVVGESKFDRASALKDWRDYLSDGGTIAGLETYRANYDADDWTWLMENVNK